MTAAITHHGAGAHSEEHLPSMAVWTHYGASKRALATRQLTAEHRQHSVTPPPGGPRAGATQEAAGHSPGTGRLSLPGASSALRGSDRPPTHILEAV